MKKLMNLSLHTGGILAAVFALITAIVLLVLPVAPAQSASAPHPKLNPGAAKALQLAPNPRRDRGRVGTMMTALH